MKDETEKLQLTISVDFTSNKQLHPHEHSHVPKCKPQTQQYGNPTRSSHVYDPLHMSMHRSKLLTR